MLIIEVGENEPIDKALKRYKRKFRNCKLLEEMRERSEYTKPSEKRRKQLIKAQYNSRFNKEN